MNPQQKRRLRVLEARQRAALKMEEKERRRVEKEQRNQELKHRRQKVELNFKYRKNPQVVRQGLLDDMRENMEKVEQQEIKIKQELRQKLGLSDDDLNKPDVVVGKPVARAKLENFQTVKGLKEYAAKVKRQANKNMFKTKIDIYQENLISAIRDRFMMTDEVQELIDEINKLSPEQIQWMLIKDPDIFNIQYIYYDPDTQDTKIRLLMEVVGKASEKQFDKVEV